VTQFGPTRRSIRQPHRPRHRAHLLRPAAEHAGLGSSGAARSGSRPAGHSGDGAFAGCPTDAIRSAFRAASPVADALPSTRPIACRRPLGVRDHRLGILRPSRPCRRQRLGASGARACTIWSGHDRRRLARPCANLILFDADGGWRRAAAGGGKGGVSMAQITLDQTGATPTGPIRRAEQDYALKEVRPHVWDGRRLCAAGALRLRQDHAAQHHLGPRRAASEGRFLFDGQGRDALPTAGAQHRPGVPVPGRLRHDDRARQPRLPAAQPRRRRGRRSRPASREIAEIDLTSALDRKARRLTADAKQKISLGPRPGALRRQRDPVRRAADRHRPAS
jgi:hypothetical protein